MDVAAVQFVCLGLWGGVLLEIKDRVAVGLTFGVGDWA